MKRAFLLFCSLLFSGCKATVPVNTHGLSSDDVVKFTSRCNRTCQEFVGTLFPVQQMATIFGKDNIVDKYVILAEIDGQRGSNTYFEPSGAYNSNWDGSFDINTSPGTKEISIRPSAYKNAPNDLVQLTFDAKSGQTYLIGRIGWRSLEGRVQINNWSPIIMNLGNNTVIFPEGEPSWRKFCTLHQEWAGAADCP